MRVQPGSSASLHLAALLLGTAIAWPAGAQTLPAGGSDRTSVAAIISASDAEIALPDLPVAQVTINPSDLATAPPAAAAAPAPVAAATAPVVTPAPSSLPNHAGRTASVDGATGSILPTGPGTRPIPTEPAPQAPASPTPTLPKPAEASPPAAAPPVVAAVLDPSSLRGALEAFVGPEPAPVAGRVPAADLARFKDRQAIAAVYAARHDAPFWIEEGRFNAQARSALSRIDHAPEDGLDMRGSAIAVPRGGDAATLAASELSLTQAVVAYARQAEGGRVDPARLSPLIAAQPVSVDPGQVLDTLASAPDAGEALRAFNPPHKGYLLLRAKLAELRQKTDVAGQAPIPYGPILKPGMRDARVPLIRARFGLDIPPSSDVEAGLVYDTRVAAAVADFQRAHHLPPSGVLTIRTIATLSGGNPRRLESEIIANMERWRWLPRDLGQDYIQVNVPDFTLDVMHGGTLFHHTRVVVGQPDKATPIFSETMKFIIVNPYWNVPLSIVKKEMMPKAAEDPNYFTNHGYETVERDGVTYVRQPPGETNALGRIKFMFPNKYSVYLHDTNARALFGKDQRALSHGCVRVEAPFKLAEVVLGAQNGWTEARVKKMIGGSERTIMLPAPLPLHIVYFTAFVDDKGELQLRDDVYGYSGKLRQALGLDS